MREMLLLGWRRLRLLLLRLELLWGHQCLLGRWLLLGRALLQRFRR